MKRKLPKTRGIFIERDILESDAFWDLNGTAIKVFMVFRLKCKISNNSYGKRDLKRIVNNGELVFTFQEAKKKYRIPKSTFLRARDQLIKLGFIAITDEGGCHHTTKYSISNNWKKYPNKTFERAKSGNLVGIRTRWEKGTAISGTNNQSSTANNDTYAISNGTNNDA